MRPYYHLALRTAAIDRLANTHDQGALSRRSWRRCPPASRTDEPPRSHLADSHTGPPNASRSCRPDRRQWPTKGRIPQSLPEQCLSASLGPLLERRLASQLQAPKEQWRTVRQSRNISSETPLVGSSRSVGSCLANAMFLAFVPGRRVAPPVRSCRCAPPWLKRGVRHSIVRCEIGEARSGSTLE
jgi:hypothetical protein